MGPILGVAWPEGTPCTPTRALGVDAPTTAHGVAEKWTPRVRRASRGPFEECRPGPWGCLPGLLAAWNRLLQVVRRATKGAAAPLPQSGALSSQGLLSCLAGGLTTATAGRFLCRGASAGYTKTQTPERMRERLSHGTQKLVGVRFYARGPRTEHMRGRPSHKAHARAPLACPLR